MAAPDAKTSPSSKEIHCSVEGTATEPKEAHAAVENEESTSRKIASPKQHNVTDIQPIAPSYESVQASEQYVLAKSLLSSGDFERALELIEATIVEYKAVLTCLDVDNVDLHECMAPWHYLYGTTLLYQIEESSDTQMTMGDPETDDANPSESHDVEDMEIAWENLETARTITESLLTVTNPNSDKRSRLELDLAQILLREADLQRWNGRYADAIPDYTQCLQLRQRHLPPLDRQLADVQYNLGLSHLSQSTELNTSNEELTQDILRTAQEHCLQGVSWYLKCARTLCGQIAHLCGVEDSLIFGATAGTGGLKTTGLDDAQLASVEASSTLRVWRDSVATMDTRLCAHLVELLEEIQETVRESEESQRAVREAAEMKWKAQRAVVESEDGITTRIGFGGDFTSSSASAMANSTEAKPMMVKKKKTQKRNAEGETGDVANLKKSKTEE